jgi:hypothetical protein
MSNESFNFSKFIQDSRHALLKPKEFFATMPTTGGFVEPIIKAVLYGTIAGIFALIWSLLHIGQIGGGLMGGLLGNAVGIMAFLSAIIGALVGLFIGGVFVLLASAICGGSTDYEASVRVTASLMVLSPVSAFFGFLGFLSILSSLVGLIVSLYGVWMLYHALIGSLKGKAETSKIVGIVLAVIVAIFSIMGMASKKMVTDFSNKYEDVMKEAMEEYEEATEEALEDLENAEEE